MSGHMVLLFVALVAPSAAILRGTGTQKELNLNLLLTDMHPEVVGRLLSQVGKRWEEGCVSSLRNQTDAAVALGEMSKSCAKVAKAIVDGSDGDKDKVVEYMSEVCSADKASEEQKNLCGQFSSEIESFMTDDAETNRNGLNFPKFCEKYWSSAVTPVAKLLAEKLDTEDAERAKEQAEREQKEQEERERQQEESVANARAHEVEEAANMTKKAAKDGAKADVAVKDVEALMQKQEEEVNKLEDQARKELQVASEKEATAAEAKATKVKEEAAAAEAAAAEAKAQKAQKAQENEEAAAKAAGDAKADAIAEKAVEKAEEATPPAKAENVTAAAKDDEEAKKAGDAMAEEIAEKAEEKAEEKEMKAQEEALKAAPKKAAALAVRQTNVTKNTTTAAKSPAKEVKKAAVSKK